MANIDSFHGIPQDEHAGRGTAWAVLLTACVSFWATVIFFGFRYL